MAAEPEVAEPLATMAAEGHEQVVFCHDRASGLRAIVAIWSTVLGPALGGVRFRPYADESTALADVMRLSQAMGYKNACAGLDLGGGKAVIIGDPHRDRSEALLRAFGRFVDSLGGRYLTAADVGTTVDDMETIRRETPFVTGISAHHGGSGDPSPMTAIGVFEAIRAALAHLDGTADGALRNRHIAIQGVGKVGSALAALLAAAGARLTVADVDDSAVNRVVAATGADVVPVEKIRSAAVDAFAPCALGGVISPETIAELHCSVVCGAANNQLTDDDLSDELASAGILYIPDFVANAGGVINIADELAGEYDRARAEARIRRIGATTTEILAAADAGEMTPLAAAARRAETRIQSLSEVARIRTGRLTLPAR